MATRQPAREDRRAKKPSHPRDTEASAFAQILAELISRVPGAQAASLVDRQGESVDYWGRVDPFDVKVAAAHWRIVLDELAALRFIGRVRTLVVRGTRRSFVAHALPEDYAVVVLLGKRAGFCASTRAFAACERALHLEASWETAGALPPWLPVHVATDRRRRPTRVWMAGNDVVHEVEVLGAVMGLARRDKGFRVRLDSGAEVTLVREPGGFWYADDALDARAAQRR